LYVLSICISSKISPLAVTNRSPVYSRVIHPAPTRSTASRTVTITSKFCPTRLSLASPPSRGLPVASLDLVIYRIIPSTLRIWPSLLSSGLTQVATPSRQIGTLNNPSNILLRNTLPTVGHRHQPQP
jgi:hypothetical protein